MHSFFRHNNNRGFVPWYIALIFGYNPKRTLARLAVITLLVLVFFNYITPPVRVDGTSMEPAFRDNALHIGNSIRYKYRDPQPGDVVIIRMAGRKLTHLKRILAVPGNSIEFRDGTLLVNGRIRNESYLVHTGNWNMQEMILSEDEYFVAGDNRDMPMEMHTMGAVDKSRIIGGILF